MTWSGEWVSSGEVDLWCLDSRGSGSAVLLLHGLAGYSGEWAATLEALFPLQRVVAFDQRGHGRSTRNPVDVSREAFVADVLRVTAALELGPVTLVGQSMGAHTAMLTAAQDLHDVVGRLVLIEGGVGGGGAAATGPVARLLRGWPAPFLDHAAAVSYFGGGTVGSTWARGLLAKDDGLWPSFDAEVLVSSLDAVHERACWDEWGQVQVPTLLVLGEHGEIPKDEVRRMHESNARCDVVTVDGVGHDVHLEAPREVNELLRRFIADN